MVKISERKNIHPYKREKCHVPSYYINGDVSDVRKENLTNSLTEYKIMKIGLNKFKDMCLDDGVSLRKIAKYFGISPQAVKKYIVDKNITISDNKSRK